MRRYIAVLSVLALYACDSGGGPGAFIGTGGGGNTSAVGTYALQTVNSAPPPTVLVWPGVDRFELLDDRMVLADSSWTEIGHARETVNGVVNISTLVDAGTYTVSGSTITFRITSPGSNVTSFQGTLNGNSLVFTGVNTIGNAVEMTYSR
jgi:hypothetical protein